MDITTSWIKEKLISYGVPARDAGILSAVAYGESGYNPAAVGDEGDSIGLFQVNIPAHYSKLENWTGSGSRSTWESWLKDPEHNVFAASEVYKSQGLGAWTVYNNGSYRAYLDEGYSIPYTGVSLSVQGGDSGVSSYSGFIVLGVVLLGLLLRGVRHG